MKTTLVILGQVHGFDVELRYDDVEQGFDVNAHIAGLKEAGLTPRPRFTKSDNGPFEPFTGVVEKTEVGGKTQKGNEYYIAHVRPITASDQPQKELFVVKYYDKRSTWRDGDRVRVSKDDKGFINLKEDDGQPPF